ncbi:phenylalanine 4-monooxygenase [Ferrimonas balearica]|uniref:phenylalanine 4-monooxygenase n=1 Tax=Ferrimonas balearica TaxID=44012 RepID=UPI001C5784CA|nr:phenylalanine 4-monooxygenase [Ferrimonas balearica]MBW3140232.1 phenylalanine 4-monooxygenase [Ferrimonas balearica]MBW3166241.1 phenylalanine 4-monooxygenase [Ferrimonas balearica]MBY5979884.1 phenylalanine 4-monooxygenase [Ferrimonas balearica]MBY6106659.1 phenylalanine 4-monooxygenase [Ferrimonas balearica]MBY6224784.1 phenylalanine 4-monooxygenase [Ferrimonas balearica]
MKGTQYQARQPDEQGFIHYSDEEHRIWAELVERQLACIQGKACDEFMAGLAALDLPRNRIPQLAEVDAVLEAATGWRTAQVPALISFERFFELLASKQFPVATFIRTREEFDYLQEPDIFHEIFGHCPLLTNPAFAHFTHTYGKLGLAASPKERVYLARLYWFTVEFGLVNTAQGKRIYGGGILSSPGETLYALSGEPEHQPMAVLDAMRTPYRIDIMQPIYYVLNNIDDLFALSELDLMALVHEAMALGLFEPKFPPKSQAS